MVKLDVKDRKILYELGKNARLSASQIGKRVGLSWDVVNYRIKQLEKKKLIEQYTLIINIYKLGKHFFRMYFRFQHISRERNEKIISDLESSPHVKWIARCDGRFDLIIGVVADSPFEFEKFKNSIFEKYGDVIATKSMTTMISYKSFGKSYLVPQKTQKEVITGVGLEEGVKIDQKDIRLIKALEKNSRATIVELAKKSGLTQKMVRYRMQNLEKKRVIKGYHTVINKQKIGYKCFKCFICIENAGEKRLKQLEQHINFSQNITYMTYTLGEWELELECEVEDEEKFYRIVEEIRTKFFDIIKTIDTVMIFREKKFSLA